MSSTIFPSNGFSYISISSEMQLKPLLGKIVDRPVPPLHHDHHVREQQHQGACAVAVPPAKNVGKTSPGGLPRNSSCTLAWVNQLL